MATESPLPDDLPTCQQMIHQLLETLSQRDRELDRIRHQLDSLLRRLYGPRSEKLNGPTLFDGYEPPPVSEPTPTPVELPPQTPSTRSGHGRQKLPQNLPRQRIEHDLSEAEKLCPGCGHERVCIGHEVGEQWEYQPASMYIVEHAQAKYVCRRCSRHHQTADKPPSPIDKGLAGPGLLSHLVTSKYSDHLPLHRLEGILSRQGVDLSRSTMCRWMASCAVLLTTLYQRMRERVLQSKVVHTDDTVVPVQDDRSTATKQGRLWVYTGDTAHPFACFDYTPTHSRDGPQRLLKDYSGYLQADAYRGYDAIYSGGKIHEVACWAHARRKFVECQVSDAARVHTALGFIAQLYAIERETKEKSDSQRVVLRQIEAVPILERFHSWLMEQKRQVLPKSSFAQALDYTLSNYPALMRYTEAGYLNIDNNLSERTLRLVAIGRKNWLACGSDAGGKTASVLYSFTATCKHLGIDPFVYLRDLFTHLPSLSNPTEEELDFWLPDAWRIRQRQTIETAS
jgi:transposase